VSCSSASSCMAVGDVVNRPHGIRTIAERWDGTDWSVTPTIDYSHYPASRLDGVSCTSPSLCVAVGGDLVERWDGTTWSRQPIPYTHHVDLSGVSCLSRTWCLAVGRHNTPENRAYAQVWNGQEWLPLRPRSPTSSAEFDGVSCSATSRCVAVGYATPNLLEPLRERWNGTDWTNIYAH
jgi:hypothetical protein